MRTMGVTVSTRAGSVCKLSLLTLMHTPLMQAAQEARRREKEAAAPPPAYEPYGRGGGGGGGGDRNCYQCGKPGHIARECPSKQQVRCRAVALWSQPGEHGTGRACIRLLRQNSARATCADGAAYPGSCLWRSA